MIAGLTRRSHWQRLAALTRPYLTTRLVIAAPDPDTAAELSSDLGGRRIAVEANSAAAAKLTEDTDATAVPVADPAEADGPVVVDDYLSTTSTVSMGENAFLVELERFLLDREAQAAAILEREDDR